MLFRSLALFVLALALGCSDAIAGLQTNPDIGAAENSDSPKNRLRKILANQKNQQGDDVEALPLPFPPDEGPSTQIDGVTALFSHPKGKEGRFSCIGFSSDDQLVAAGDTNGTVFVWKIGTKQLLHEIQITKGRVRALAFSKKGTLLAVGAQDSAESTACTVSVWKLIDGAVEKPQRTFQDVPAAIERVQFAPDGKWLVVSGNPEDPRPEKSEVGHVVILKVDDGTRPVEIPASVRGRRTIDVAFAYDGALLTLLQRDGKGNVLPYAYWHNQKPVKGAFKIGKPLNSLTGWVPAPNTMTEGLSLAGSGLAAARVHLRVSGDSVYRELEMLVAGGGPAREYLTLNIKTPETGATTALACSNDERYVAVAFEDHHVRTYDVLYGQLVRKLPKIEHSASQLLFDYKGSQLVSLHGHELRVWGSTSQPRPLLATKVPNAGSIAMIDAATDVLADGDFTCGSYSQNGEFFAAGDTQGSVRVWKTGTTVPIAEFRVAAGPLISLDLADDGNRLVTLAQQSNTKRPRIVSVWDVNKKQEIRRLFSEPFCLPHEVHISPNGKLVIAGIKSIYGLMRGYTIPSEHKSAISAGGIVWDVSTGDQVGSGFGSRELIFGEDADTVISMRVWQTIFKVSRWSLSQKQEVETFPIRGDYGASGARFSNSEGSLSPRGTAAFCHVCCRWHRNTIYGSGDYHARRHLLRSWSLVPLQSPDDQKKFGTGNLDTRRLYRVTLPTTLDYEIYDDEAELYRASAISDDGRYVILVRQRDSVIEMWDLRYGRLLRRLHEGGAEIKDVVLSPAGNEFITVGAAGVLRWRQAKETRVEPVRIARSFAHARPLPIAKPAKVSKTVPVGGDVEPSPFPTALKSVEFLTDAERQQRVRDRANQFVDRAIPNSPNVRTSRDERDKRLAMSRKFYVESYKQFGLKDPAWDKLAEDYFELEAKLDAEDLRSAETNVSFLGKQLIKLRCQDPLFLTTWARRLLRNKATDTRRIQGLFAAAARRFDKSDYPVAQRWAASLAFLATLEPGSPRYLSTFERTIKELQSAAAELEDNDAARRVFLSRILMAFRLSAAAGTSEQKIESLTKLYDALATTKDLDPWIQEMAGAYALRHAAWIARGKGPADRLSLAARERFITLATEGQKHAVNAWCLKPQLPEAATEMISLVMGLKGFAGETIRFWFDEAVAAQMDYEPAYVAYRWALRPRWAGSERMMVDFAAECVETGRHDTYIPSQIWNILLDLNEEAARKTRDPRPLWVKAIGHVGIYEAVEEWTRERIAFDKLHGNDPEEALRKSYLMCIAWHAGREQEARKLVDELGPNVNLTATAQFDVVNNLRIQPGSADRRVAELTLNVDGKMTVQSGTRHVAVQKFSDLPQGKYWVVSADLSDRRHITDAHLQRLAKLTEITELGLRNTRITDSGLKALHSLITLEKLDLTGTRTTDQGIKELQKVLPLCEIVR